MQTTLLRGLIRVCSKMCMRVLLVDPYACLSTASRRQLYSDFAVDLLTNPDEIECQLCCHDYCSVVYVATDCSIVEHQLQKTRTLQIRQAPWLVVGTAPNTAALLAMLSTNQTEYVDAAASCSEFLFRLKRLITLSPSSTVPMRYEEEMEQRFCRIPLNRKERRLLRFMTVRNNQILSQCLLLEQIWENDTVICSNTVAVHISRLRKKLRAVGYRDCIKTCHGIGYMFLPPKITDGKTLATRTR